MTDRLKEIYSILPSCKVFADIGCDHGYITNEMLKNSKCHGAIASDISEKCLLKAKKLLLEYIESGKCEAVVSNGFQNIKGCDLALIAGMGGEEIISIIKNAKDLPERLVLQPMKNVDKVRVFALSMGYKILKDYVFYADKKYYDLLLLEKGEDSLTKEEILLGRTNISRLGEAFKSRNRERILFIEKLLSSDKIKEQDKKLFFSEMEMLKKYV